MIRKYTTLALALLLAAAPALADESVFSGELAVSGQLIDGSSNLSAKFNEYRDLSDDVLSGGFSLFVAEAGRFLSIEGTKLGQDDQSLKMQWGQFDTLRFSLFHDQLTHNYSFDDRTLYSNVGTDNLVLGPGVVLVDPATWLPLDFSVERKVIGGGVKANFGTPYFVSLEVNQTEKEGVLPFSVNHSPGGGSYFVMLPLPIDYTTTNLTAKAGYGSKTLLASVDFSASSFDNASNQLTWVSPGTNNTPISLAPDNDMWQLGGQLVLKQLPLNSTLALRGSFSQLESNPVLTTADDFDGDITYTTASVSLRSVPMPRLETDLTYRYVDKDNNADHFTFGGVDTHIFYYTKHNAAAEASYRVTDADRITLGYEFTKVDRSEEMRHDAEETKDHLVSAEWKNTRFDFLTSKLRYEHLERNTEFNGAPVAGVPDSAIYLWIRPFDAADKSQDKFKVSFDVMPCDFADLGLSYTYVTADFDETVLGLTDERTQELMIDTSISLPRQARLYGYVAYEQAENSSFLRRYNNANAALADPGYLPISTSNYNWSVDREDATWSYGVKAELPLLNERLKLTAAWDHQKNEGDAKFKAADPTVDAAMIDIDNYGDYIKRTLSLKAEYAMTAVMTLTGGFLYEKYELDDIQYNDYQYTYNSGASRSYLTGAYADADYDAKVGYVTLAYKF